jgi:hypothetical protein
MLMPNVTENLSVERRELERVRRSLADVREPPRSEAHDHTEAPATP